MELKEPKKLKHKWNKLASGRYECSECALIKEPPSHYMSCRWAYWYPPGRGNGQKLDKTYCYKRNEKTNI